MTFASATSMIPELRHNISISYEVVVPAETDLRVQSGSGDQRVEGIRGPLEVSAGSGGLKISAIGDRVHAETGSGDIDINRVKGNVHAKTGSGSIDASDIAGAFEADTGSGHITLQQTAPGSVRVDTGSGGMELHGVQGSLEAKAGSGDHSSRRQPHRGLDCAHRFRRSATEAAIRRGFRSGRPYQLRLHFGRSPAHRARLHRTQGGPRPGRSAEACRSKWKPDRETYRSS